MDSPLDYSTTDNNHLNSNNNNNATAANRKQSVHERLLNNETKSLRPYIRKAEQVSASNQPMTLIGSNVKQNAIKFAFSEFDY